MLRLTLRANSYVQKELQKASLLTRMTTSINNKAKKFSQTNEHEKTNFVIYKEQLAAAALTHRGSIGAEK